MSITIGSNIASLRAQSKLGESSETLQRTYERLSSGMRINRASDDAAGLAISTALASDARVFSQAIRNGNDAISVLGIAEGAVQQLAGIVTRISELAEQSANGVYSSQQRRALDTEAQSLREEYNRIIQSTKANGQYLLDGSLESMRIQVGYGEEGSIAFSLGAGLGSLVGDGTFQDEIVLSGGFIVPIDITTGDFDSDGVDDLVYWTQADEIGFFHGNGDGTFTGPITRASIGNIGNQATVLSGDYNGDGNLDVSYTVNTDGTVEVMLGNGDGTFQAPTAYTAADPLDNINQHKQIDVNNDGRLDLIVHNLSDYTLEILMGQADGSFSAPTSLDPAAVAGFTYSLADVDNDGNADIVVASPGPTSAVEVWKGNGDGTFSSAGVTALSTMNRYQSLVLGDFDGDGYVDYAALAESSTSIGIALNDGNGNFVDDYTFDTAGTFNSQLLQLIAQDMNGDGLADLVSMEGTSSQVSLHISNGDGTFTLASTSAITADSRRPDIGDFNNDGVPDIVTTGYVGSTFSILLANTTTSNILQTFSIETQSDARNTLDEMGEALTRTSTELSNIGAIQSRLQVAINALGSTRENVISAKSQILDTDVAADAAILARESILQQAAASVLAQANLNPELALSLLV